MTTPARPFDPHRWTLTLRGMPVTYTDDGDLGPAIVMIHGLPGSARDFRWLASAQRERDPPARVIRLDLPGFGGTDRRLGGAMRLSDRARFVVDVLDAIGVEEAILVGHSMGGPVALGAAAELGPRACGVFLLASVGRTPHAGYRASPHPPTLAAILTNPLTRRLLARPMRAGFVHLGFPSSTPTSELQETMRTVGKFRFADSARAIDRVGALGVPAEVFVAADDPLVEVPIAHALTHDLRARLTVFEDGGHNIQKTQAVELAARLLAMHEEAR
jgi:pimeloyl-ACP methyl ester carboxylesterase